ncbi:MAG: VPLPA-CTERM sorting domain-containing protein [Pseudomonadota bacterium]
MTVQYFVEDPIAPIPLPAAAWMMLAALGSLFAVRRFSKT